MSKSPPDSSQRSLDEFEEYERLIRENTAVDSDADEDDIHEDTSAAEPTTPKQPVEASTHGDTGYQSVPGALNGQSLEALLAPERDADDSRLSEISSTSSSSSRSSLKRTHLAFASESSHEYTDKSESGRSTPADPGTSTPYHEHATDGGTDYHHDSDNDGKLVATFGTTEKFEALLKQQLENDDGNASENDVARHSDAEKLEQRQQVSSPPHSARIKFPRQRSSIHNRTTRSPAANRLRKANKSKPSSARSHSPGLPESSDDLSVQSDASHHELRQRLRKSKAEREKEQTITKQLQTDYDDLLTKFAEAENVIDQLRIGAKIDLFANLPNSSAEEQNNLNDNNQPLGISQMSTSAASLASPRIPGNARSSQDSITENSLKLPSAASMEFLRIALEHQANDLREQVESFNELLKGDHVAENEKQPFFNDVVSALNKLQGDYIAAGKEHEAEKRALILSGNANGMEFEDFDPGRKIEGEIFQLGRMVEDLREKIQINPSLPQTPTSSRRYLNSARQTDSDESRDSTLDIDDDFNRQLRRYNKDPIGSDAEEHTTASSRFLSSDEDTVGYSGKGTPRRAHNADNTIPDRFLRPQSASSASPSKSFTRPASSHADSSPTRSSYPLSKADSSFQHSPDVTDSRQRPRSRLPRPVGNRSHSTPAVPRAGSKLSSSHEMDIDSGFVGSESSRQSAATAPLKSDPRLQKLSPVHSGAYSESPSSAHTQQKPPKPVARQGKNKNTKKSTLPNKGQPLRAFQKEKLLDDQNSSDTMIAGSEAPSFASKKVLRAKVAKSDDGSAWSSVSGKPTPAFSRQHIPSGTSGGQAFSMPPYHGSPYHASPSPEKSRPDSRRSLASSSKDSTLDLLRGEIAKLRQELRENKALAESSPKHSSKSRHGYTSESQATEATSTRGRRPTRSQGRRRVSKQRSKNGSDCEMNDAKTKKKDAKSGSDAPITAEDKNEENSNVNPPGHWEYIPPYFSPTHMSPRPINTIPVVHQASGVYSSPVHIQSPVVQVEPTYYSSARYPSPARIYIPVSPSVGYKTIPVEERRFSRRSSIHLSQAATQTSLRGDENDKPLTRSQLISSSTKRSSSVPPLRQSFLDPQLSISLARAERAANTLRQKSRGMYRSLRDSMNRAELSSTFA